MAPRALTRTSVDVEVAKISTQLDNQDEVLKEIKTTLSVAVTKETHENFKREVLDAHVAMNARSDKLEEKQDGFFKMIIGAYGLFILTIIAGLFVLASTWHHT